LRAGAGAAGSDETTILCEHCGSQFKRDANTRRSRYSHVAQEYAAVAPQLTGNWLTRRQVFEACQVLRSTAPAATAPAATTPGAAPRAQAPVSMFWLAVLGAAGVIAMTCACLSALLLGPSMAETRRQIAAANAPQAAALAGGAPVTDTGVLTGEATAAPGDSAWLIETPGAPLETETPAPADAPPAEAAPPPTVIVVTEPPQPVEVFPEPQPTPAPPEAGLPPAPASTPTLPPTFTPAPSPTASPTAQATVPVDPLNSPLPAATSIAPTAPPAPADPPTPTPPAAPVTPSVTPTSGVVMTGAIVIGTVMYQGDPNLNEGDEYVEIENRGNDRVNMGFWTLRSVSTNAVFSFGNAVGMDPGNVCRIYTYIALPDQRCGIGSALTFLSTVPVWSNTGDVAELRDANGVLISRFIYGTPPAFQP
jgi:hypothetical protein